MAQLSSPGVAVSVADESFYTPAAAGTVPLIIVASQESKQNAAGTGIAPGTLKANAGAVYLLTSQMDLGNTFGVPYFQTDASNNPVHAGELNEYGLQAAYSFLGVSNRAYVVRADLDTSQLISSADAPAGKPANGTVWFDTTDSKFGVFQWNAQPATVTGGQTFTNKSVTVITSADQVNNDGAPLASIGALGDYAVVATTSVNTLWLKKFQTSTAAGTWVEVGTDAWISSWPTVSSAVATGSLAGKTFAINGESVTMTDVTDATGLAHAINTATFAGGAQGVTASAINGNLALYGTVDIDLSGSAVEVLGLSLAVTYYPPALTLAPHYQVPTYKTHDTSPRPTGSIWIKTTAVNVGAQWVVKKYVSATSSWAQQSVQLFANNASALTALDPKGGGLNLAKGALFVKYNTTEVEAVLADFEIYARKAVGATKITSVVVDNNTFVGGSYSFNLSETVAGSSTVSTKTVSFSPTKSVGDAQRVVTAINSAGFTNVVAILNADNSITISHTLGGEMQFTDTDGKVAVLFPTNSTANLYTAPAGAMYDVVATLWAVSTAVTSATAPTTKPADGTLWYDGNIIDEVDIMVNDGEGGWLGYANFDQHTGPGGDPTDPAGPLVTATQPTEQSDGSALANGDIWIDTSDLENYPMIYKYNILTQKWVLLDNADQTTENGVLFHDARWNTTGGAESATIAELLSSDFLDFDAPDPALYPKGMLLWNLRRSGFNVKKYHVNYVDINAQNHMMDEPMSDYAPDRWVSAAANHVDGSGAFGRKAQRAVVLAALEATIQGNQQIRQPDIRVFNLISVPGYIETLKSTVGLNTDNGQTAFVVGDTPARLSPDATTLNNWGNNVNNAAVDGDDGLITTDAYAAVYYPWGYTTDLKGNNIVVPPSHMMLRTIALSDNVSYPWFAPAGVRRGGITNASSVGYVNPTTGEFNTVALNIGQRDTLAGVHVNPITYLTGTGLVCYGQKTRQLVASSLDRINVARLVIYLRRQLDLLAKPFVFEPNDTITRNEIKQQVEKLLLELVGQRALYDYLVVCDTSNNTPARIDRNELHVDIAIEPVKAVEFIYIPLRLENTGAIKGL